MAEYETDITQAKREGLEQGLEQTACFMIRDNLPIETIAKYTSLPVEKIETMKGEKEKMRHTEKKNN